MDQELGKVHCLKKDIRGRRLFWTGEYFNKEDNRLGTLCTDCNLIPGWWDLMSHTWKLLIEGIMDL